jgi:hypothetical protein
MSCAFVLAKRLTRWQESGARAAGDKVVFHEKAPLAECRCDISGQALKGGQCCKMAAAALHGLSVAVLRLKRLDFVGCLP